MAIRDNAGAGFSASVLTISPRLYALSRRTALGSTGGRKNHRFTISAATTYRPAITQMLTITAPESGTYPMARASGM